MYGSLKQEGRGIENSTLMSICVFQQDATSSLPVVILKDDLVLMEKVLLMSETDEQNQIYLLMTAVN